MDTGLENVVCCLSIYLNDILIVAATIQIQENQITPRTIIRVLGVQVDSKLHWGPHIRYVQAKIAR